ncbi:hypothetical protein [Methylobacterium sp. Leaf466]|uniref:hypothetical protein n=1 Tax=Methylobacterium sp. Leaf466 TaxID=1736386 RepID=UPI0006FF70E8|nr:hypothetical protein [Methylobacterium sp. Leaf466]KQT84454.1 hypothetical protein ASG59_03525 [Methylobacterium sp. Leaf466]
MSFVLRAVLVIGALSYFAAQRDAPDAGPRAAAVSPASLWNALPPDLRERAIREAAAEATRQMPGATSSRDTLAAADRRPAWRGVDVP